MVLGIIIERLSKAENLGCLLAFYCNTLLNTVVSHEIVWYFNSGTQRDDWLEPLLTSASQKRTFEWYNGQTKLKTQPLWLYHSARQLPFGKILATDDDNLLMFLGHNSLTIVATQSISLPIKSFFKSALNHHFLPFNRTRDAADDYLY